MKEFDKSVIRQWIDQLIGQDFLCKAGEYNVLNITEQGSELLRGKASPRLTAPPKSHSPAGSQSHQSSSASWEGVDRALFELLKMRRSELAEQRQTSADVIFSDASLRDMAKRRPSNADSFHLVLGVGREKLAQFAESFLEVIVRYCTAKNVSMDVVPAVAPKAPVAPNKSAVAAFEFFQQGQSVEEAAEKLGRAVSTTQGYLAEYIRFKQVKDISPWVDNDTAERVREAVKVVGADQGLKPIYIQLGEQVGYNEIKLVLASLEN